MEATAASIAFITFALQGVSQVYELWHRVRDIPDEVDELLSDLTMYAGSFKDLDAQIANSNISLAVWNSTQAPLCLERAKVACAAMESHVQSLKIELSHPQRKYKIMAKAVLGEGKMAHLKKRLSRAKEALNLSLQNCVIALMINSHAQLSCRFDDIPRNVIGEFMQQTVLTLPTLTPKVTERYIENQKASKSRDVRKNKDELENEKHWVKASEWDTSAVRSRASQKSFKPSPVGRFAVSYRADTGAWRAYIQLPSWLSTTVYELETAPVISGWKFCARTYTVLPQDHEIVPAIKYGDLEGVRELFQTGRVSPFDRTHDGTSLLFYAFGYRQLEILELLLSKGLYVHIDDPEGSCVQLFMDLRKGSDGSSRTEKFLPALRILQPYLSLDPDLISTDRFFEWRLDIYTHLSTFRGSFMLNYDERIASDRFEAFRLGCFAELQCHNVRSMLSDWDRCNRYIRKEDVRMSTGERLSVLNSVAYAMGRRLPWETIPVPRIEAYPLTIWGEGWYAMVVDAASVAETRDLHAVDEMVPWNLDPIPIWKGSPLISAIAGTVCFLSPNYQYSKWDKALQSTIKYWARALEEAGVDLMEYGAREQYNIRHDVHGFRGIFDGEAINRSRGRPRRKLAEVAQLPRRCDRVNTYPDVTYEELERDSRRWRPLRLLELKIGASPDDWELEWVVEFEEYAREFWQLIHQEKPATMTMPGSWVDE